MQPIVMGENSEEMHLLYSLTLGLNQNSGASGYMPEVRAILRVEDIFAAFIH